MTQEKKPDEKLSQEKALYEFGKVEKFVIEPKELELAVFACADAMPGGDGRDPTRLPALT